MTDIKQAQAAFDCKPKRSEFGDNEYIYQLGSWLNHFNDVVDKAIKAYIEGEQGRRTDVENIPEDNMVLAILEGHKTKRRVPCVIYGVDDGYKDSDGCQIADEFSPVEWQYIGDWPTPTEQEEV